MVENRVIGTGIIVIVVVLVVGTIGVSALVYQRLSATTPRCEAHPDEADNTPAAFVRAGFDTSPYLIEDYQEVSFPSRDPDVTISAWFIPAKDTDSAAAPTVIIVHGYNDCRQRAAILTPAAMLHNNGFNVLAIDLRGHGESAEGARMAAGTEEYRDVLGAWDWLLTEKGFLPERIGLMGFSLGGATVTIAAAQEPRVAAVWEDSAFADFLDILKLELQDSGIPSFFAPGAAFVGRLISGDDITAIRPVDAVTKFEGRPYYIVHGDADTRIPVSQATRLAETINANGGVVKPWILPGTAHIEAVFDAPDEYERRLIEFFSTSLADRS